MYERPFDDGTRETLARTLHEDYVRRVREIEGDVERPELMPWTFLGEDVKECYRRQVDDIDDKLVLIDSEIVAADAVEGLFLFKSDEIELLARHEHERWMFERLGQGWALGDVRDPESKVHPCLVPYEALSEVDKERDRDAVRRIPTLLALVGLAIARA